MFKVTPDGVVVGRSRDADVRLLDDGISRRHARIWIEDDHVHIEDLASRNGTFCNGEPVERRKLKDGDKLQIGRTTILKFTYHDKLDESFQRQMYDSALRDGLTRAFNKRYLLDRLDSEFRFAHRHHAPLAIVMIDLDHFKEVNDRHGHLVGDHVLSEVAARLRDSIRNEDVFARYGGEEFAIICRATTQIHAGVFAERLRRAIEALVITSEGRRVPMTVSIGVAGYDEVDAADAGELLAAADVALYAAKNGGKNRVALARSTRTDTFGAPTGPPGRR
jgi:diguanylate cyclase (GGDEF)-like protein